MCIFQLLASRNQADKHTNKSLLLYEWECNWCWDHYLPVQQSPKVLLRFHQTTFNLFFYVIGLPNYRQSSLSQLHHTKKHSCLLESLHCSQASTDHKQTRLYWTRKWTWAPRRPQWLQWEASWRTQWLAARPIRPRNGGTHLRIPVVHPWGLQRDTTAWQTNSQKLRTVVHQHDTELFTNWSGFHFSDQDRWAQGLASYR